MMLIFGWRATVGGWSVPMWLSWVAVVVTGGFSLAGQSLRSSTFR
jgi:hypothetical protein